MGVIEPQFLQVLTRMTHRTRNDQRVKKREAEKQAPPLAGAHYQLKKKGGVLAHFLKTQSYLSTLPAAPQFISLTISLMELHLASLLRQLVEQRALILKQHLGRIKLHNTTVAQH